MMARPRRFERLTPAFGGLYSIQLSYERIIATQDWCPRGAFAAVMAADAVAWLVSPLVSFVPFLKAMKIEK